MKYRPSKRVVWLVIPVLPLVVMGVGMWYAGKVDSEAIATRGAKAPPEKKFSLVNPQSWGVTSEWFGDGMDALMTWEYNPWKDGWKRDKEFGKRMSELAKSDRPEDKAELERLRKLGREWYERMLARYPELAVRPDKEIPRGENGFLQWQELMKRVREEERGVLFKTDLPQEVADHLRKLDRPDLAAIKTWLDENRARIDEIRAIALLPGQSSAGMPEELRTEARILWSRYAANALLLDARAAVADGDMVRALESIRAVNGLTEHLSGTTGFSLMGMMVAGSERARMQDYVLRELLPNAGSVDLAVWQAAVNPTLRHPSEMADALRGEWNMWMPNQLLPLLSDSADPGTPRDADYLAEAYTRHLEAQMRQAEGVSLKEYAASGKVVTPVDHLSRRSRDLELVNGWDPRATFLRHQEATGLALAAFAILNGQSLPLDPVYGKPYRWDPVKRELAVPDMPDLPKNRVKPLKVPEL